jgi:hypothetical protein
MFFGDSLGGLFATHVLLSEPATFRRYSIGSAALRGRGYPNLDLGLEVLPGEYHETAPPLNLSRSLRYLFDAPR